MDRASSQPWASSFRELGSFRTHAAHASAYPSASHQNGVCSDRLQSSLGKAVLCHNCLAALCREIRDHVKEDFWEIVVNYSEQSGRSCTFHWNRGRLFDHATAVALYEPCVDDPLATVLKVRVHSAISVAAS